MLCTLGLSRREQNRVSDEQHGHHRQDSIASAITLEHITDDPLATHSIQQAREKGLTQTKHSRTVNITMQTEECLCQWLRPLPGIDKP